MEKEMRNKSLIISVVLVLVVAVLMVGTNKVVAQEDVYPSKPITIIVPSSPGGGFDTVARIVASVGAKVFGVPIVVENIPGASYTLGTEKLAKSAPDGYTFEVDGDTPFAYAPHMVQVNYDPVNDFEFIAGLGNTYTVIAARSDLPCKTFDELLEYAAEHPDELTISSSSTHYNMWVDILANEGYKIKVVPFPGTSEAVVACAGGHVDLFVGSTTASRGLYEAGDIRFLCILPDIEGGKSPFEGVPLISEYPELSKAIGPLVENIKGIYAPKGIPEERLQIIEEKLYEIFQSEDYQEMSIKANIIPQWMDREEYTKYMFSIIEIVNKYYE